MFYCTPFILHRTQIVMESLCLALVFLKIAWPLMKNIFYFFCIYDWQKQTNKKKQLHDSLDPEGWLFIFGGGRDHASDMCEFYIGLLSKSFRHIPCAPVLFCPQCSLSVYQSRLTAQTDGILASRKFASSSEALKWKEGGSIHLQLSWKQNAAYTVVVLWYRSVRILCPAVCLDPIPQHSRLRWWRTVNVFLS